MDCTKTAPAPIDRILILDFGSQTTALIGRRIREMGVYTEIIAGESLLDDEILAGVKGIILSGSPESVYDKGAVPDPRIYDCGLPLLGICYGLQRMTTDLGGAVEPLPKREYGGVEVVMQPNLAGKLSCANEKAAAFLQAFVEKEHHADFTAWMSHGDTLTRLAPGFIEVGTSKTGFPAVLVHESKPWFGVQFHPEVTHTQRGDKILGAFALDVCDCKKSWTMERYLEEAGAAIRQRAGNNPVLLLISGGVDSTVAGAMLLQCLPPDNVHLMYMDCGLMRKNETELVSASLKRLGAKHLHIIHCENEFLSALAGLEAPEAKRKAIGDLFITIQEREVARLGLPTGYLLAQGTLYTDLIESGKGVGNKAHIIKSHHNVGSPLVEAKRKAGLIIEPLDKLYKDEVRALGRLLHLGEDIVRRHPFPGPGLAVRILGEVTAEKCRILREADAIFIEELKKRPCEGGRAQAPQSPPPLQPVGLTLPPSAGDTPATPPTQPDRPEFCSAKLEAQAPLAPPSLYDDIWQAFAVLLPVRSVGVAGDVRKYGQVLALRAVTSTDGMTADVYPFPTKDLIEISTLITNSVPEIGRVCYDISSKPPSTIEWE